MAQPEGTHKMHKLRCVLFLAVFCAFSAGARGQRAASTAVQQTVARIVSRENEEMKVIRQYSPLVETYIQRAKTNEGGNWAPDGDHYFVGRAEFAAGLGVKSLDPRYASLFSRFAGEVNKVFDFETEFVPKGFLQMIYVDEDGLDPASYNFEYVRQEFLGEVRTLVFDVTPSKKGKKGRFLGRIWADDRTFTIVRFNGTYSGIRDTAGAFHFDSWRENIGPNLWLPAAIYSEERPKELLATKAEQYKAQTRLWGYDAGQSNKEEELSRVLIESSSAIKDQSQANNDLSPVLEQREWNREAAENVIDDLQRIGLVSPKGEVDGVLDTVVNNLEVTNNLDLEPEVHCRVLMTSTMESFAIGHTIVLSRGLIDVLPDEATLAAMLAEQLGHVMLASQEDSKFGFYDHFLGLTEEQRLRQFNLTATPADDHAASAKAAELLKNSPYKGQLRTAGMFMAILRQRSTQIPSLINPRLGDAVFANSAVAADTEDKPAANEIVALPLGGRVKIDPWSDDLFLLKSAPVGHISERDKMPFEITPFMLYLTRQETKAARAF
jgi:hypothetical protein